MDAGKEETLHTGRLAFQTAKYIRWGNTDDHSSRCPAESPPMLVGFRVVVPDLLPPVDRQQVSPLYRWPRSSLSWGLSSHFTFLMSSPRERALSSAYTQCQGADTCVPHGRSCHLPKPYPLAAGGGVMKSTETLMEQLAMSCHLPRSHPPAPGGGLMRNPTCIAEDCALFLHCCAERHCAGCEGRTSSKVWNVVHSGA
jgi:hypothetical protein